MGELKNEYRYQVVSKSEKDAGNLDKQDGYNEINKPFIDSGLDGRRSALVYIAVITGTLMAASDGMSYGWTSPMVPYFMSNETHIPITSSQGEWMETICLLGAVAGLPFTIFGVEYLGRKKSMLFAAALACACWVIILLANTVMWIYVARFFSGTAGDMCFVAAPMYIAEIADPGIRGFLSALIYLMMLIGILTVYVVGAFAPYSVTPWIGIVITACQVIFFPFMPESPYFFIYKNQHEKAKKSLLRLRASSNVDKELNEIQTAIERQKTEKGRPQDLILIRSNRHALFIMIILNGTQHFVGISVMLMNLHIILAEAGSVYIEPSTAAICFAAIMLVSACISSSLMDRFGRKVLLISSGTLTGTTLLCMAIFFHLKYLGYDVVFISWIPAVCVMCYAAAFKLGLGLVPIVVTAEIFPTNIKSIGMTIADVVYVVAGLISISIYSALFEHFGIYTVFYLFTVCSFTSVFITIFYIPETKGKTLEEIQIMLKGTKHNSVVKKTSVNSINV